MTDPALADEITASGVRHVVLLGLGDSSLASELLARRLGPRGASLPQLWILDSPTPARIRVVESTIDLERTLFVNSGSERHGLFRHFFDRLASTLGEEAAAARFVTVPNPSELAHSHRTGGRSMKLGMIGLGRMGANIARRLLRDGHECVVYDLDRAAVAALGSEGASPASSLDDLVAQLDSTRTVWVMVPAALTDRVVRDVAPLLSPGDVIIDGGNSYYRDDIRRADDLAHQGISYVDVGTSGGIVGLERGYCLMIGGERAVVDRLDPIFRTLAPGVASAPRTRGREGFHSTAEAGYLHCGPAGAGHFVKMIHNGIEYGLMAAYAEGLNILGNAGIGGAPREADAETAPLPDAGFYRYDFDLAEIAELWRRGSVVSSWLLDLTAAALHDSPHLDDFSGRVSDSGEGRWTVHAAVDEGVPAPVLSAALYARFSSRGESDFADRVLSAMRQEFGGHGELRKAA